MASQLVWSFISVALVFAGIVLVNGAALDDRISMVSSSNNQTVYPGTHVTFTCRIQLPTGQTPVIKIKKVVYTGDRESSPIETIATLTALENPYKNLGRFSIARTEDHSDIIYTLTISAVTAEDSGTYSCTSDIPADIYAIASLKVYSPPTGISFPGFNDSTVVELTEGVIPHNLVCLVSHVMPKPDIELKVDNRILATDDVHVTTATNALCANVFVSKSCPLHQNFNLTAVPSYYKPIHTDDGTNMVCTSRMKEFNKTVNTATVHLSVRYAPKISCAPKAAIVNASNVALTCTVNANPFIPYNRTWFVTIDNVNATLMEGTEMGGEFVLSERMDRSANPKKADVTLLIKTASANRFKHKYYLKVENEIGVAYAAVKFEQLTATPPGTNGSPARRASGWTSLALMTSSFLLYFVSLC